MATGDIEDVEYVNLDSAGGFAGFAGSAGSPSPIITATLSIGTFILRLTNAPDLGSGGTWPNNTSWVYCIGSSISLIRLDPNGHPTPNGGTFLCMDRNNNVYTFNFDSYPPFRTTNLGQINENCTPQYLPVEGGQPYIQFNVTSAQEKIQIRCDVLMEADILWGFIIGQGPYGPGRWQKNVEGAVLSKGSGDQKQRTFGVTTTYLTQNPGVVLQSVG